MTTDVLSTAPELLEPRAVAEPPAGYYVEPITGAWLSLPWPGVENLPPTLADGVIEWGETNFVHPLTGGPWRYTRGQKRFLALWYALRPDGKWLYRSGVKRGAKGTGKDPLGAALALTELAGPVLLDFEAWARGEVVGQAHRLSLVQIAANSEAQAADMLRVANAMVSDVLREEHGFDTGILRTQLASGSRLELLTNSERSSEGDPATAILLNESHHMTESSGGHRLAGVARRNAGKSPHGQARLLELTNAHLQGEGSVAEESYNAWQAQVEGRTRRIDILYDSRESPAHLRMHVEPELEEGIAAAYFDSPWTDQERIRDEAQDPRVPAADSIRFYFNALPTNENAWVDIREFDRLKSAKTIERGDPIAMFLDCSKSEDATALMGCRISDGLVVTLGCWQRPKGDRGKGWLAPRDEVDKAVSAAFDDYAVQWFGIDPSPAKDDADEALYWGEMCDTWHRRYRKKVLMWASPGQVKGSSVLFDMRLSAFGGAERNRAFTEMAERTAAEIDTEGTLLHDGHPMLRLHVRQARRYPVQWGVSLGKKTRDSKNLVDCAVAMVGARLGRRIVLNSGLRLKRKRSSSANDVIVWN